MDDKMETEIMHEKWEKEFDKLENDLDSFRDYYSKTKKCKCNIDVCKHYKNAKNKVFSKRVDELWNLRLQVGFRTLNSIYEDKR
jgi:hypothetical protein